MIKNIQKKEDYKVSVMLKVPEYAKGLAGYNQEIIYIVPMHKNYNTIKTDYNQKYNMDNKTPLFYIEYGNPSYNGSVKIFEDGTWMQYRDGSFFEYVGRLAV